METFKVENLSFTYSGRTNKTLDNINFSVKRGEFVLICGKSGCGKTTLLRLLKKSLSPFGILEGNIFFDGEPLNEIDAKKDASKIGFVMQNPDNQVVCDKVWHELSFGMESLGYKTFEIRAKVSEMASFFGIESWFYNNTAELSGGQKQLLNLASVMLLNPSVLILDEPTSQLDPISSQEFLNTLKKINQELGVAVILTEHRLEDAFTLSDRVIVMDDGKILLDEKPRDVGEKLKNLNHDMFMALPTPIKVHSMVKNTLPCPLTVKDGRCWLEEYSKENKLNSDVIPKDHTDENNEKNVIEIKDVWFKYEKELPDIVKGLNLDVKKGEILAIVGGNGAGKTTILSLISGINVPYRGKVLLNGQPLTKIPDLYNGVVSVLPQNPQSVFSKDTVYLDLMDILSETDLSKEEKEKKIKEMASLLNINNLLGSHPYDLSGGEQQRSALAKVLLTEPEILLLDEPTKGIDAQFKKEFADILAKLKSKGITIIMVSHDIEFCAEHTDRCALVFGGDVVSIGTPREFFGGKNFYTTSANRMARTTLPDAVLTDDIILACGGNLPKKEKRENKATDIKSDVYENTDRNAKEHKLSPKTLKRNKERKLDKKTLLSYLIILFLVPLTIYYGNIFLSGKKYYIISLLIIFETIVPFFMAFETRKPKARELVVISVLCGLAVAGRAAFFMLYQFKPVIAIIIISAICFGSETGFLVGAVTGFVSNFFFGQGPWTPYQMFALGIIGFVSGKVCKKFINKNKVILAIYGFLATFLIYGGITNPSTMLQMQIKPTFDMLMACYLSGASFDLVHSLSTAFFLWFISKPMIDKLERVKLKYGLGIREL